MKADKARLDVFEFFVGVAFQGAESQLYKKPHKSVPSAHPEGEPWCMCMCCREQACCPFLIQGTVLECKPGGTSTLAKPVKHQTMSMVSLLSDSNCHCSVQTGSSQQQADSIMGATTTSIMALPLTVFNLSCTKGTTSTTLLPLGDGHRSPQQMHCLCVRSHILPCKPKGRDYSAL